MDNKPHFIFKGGSWWVFESRLEFKRWIQYLKSKNVKQSAPSGPLPLPQGNNFKKWCATMSFKKLDERY